MTVVRSSSPPLLPLGWWLPSSTPSVVVCPHSTFAVVHTPLPPAGRSPLPPLRQGVRHLLPSRSGLNTLSPSGVVRLPPKSTDFGWGDGWLGPVMGFGCWGCCCVVGWLGVLVWLVGWFGRALGWVGGSGSNETNQHTQTKT